MNLVGHEIAVLGVHQAHVNMAIRMAEKHSNVIKVNTIKDINSDDETSEFIDYMELAKNESSEEWDMFKLSPRERMKLKFPEEDFWK